MTKDEAVTADPDQHLTRIESLHIKGFRSVADFEIRGLDPAVVPVVTLSDGWRRIRDGWTPATALLGWLTPVHFASSRERRGRFRRPERSLYFKNAFLSDLANRDIGMR